MHTPRLLVGALALFLATEAVVRAEPWLANRYAQNCAGCHAPSRVNRPAAERRCTLSCQGCHVNPNGGGMRSFYGNWNNRRWLRSFATDGWSNNKRKPAPFRYQYYGRNTRAPDDDEELGGSPMLTPAGRSKPSAPAHRKAPSTGFPTVILDNSDYDEKDYDRSDGSEHIVVNTEEKFLERVTADDPYREERRSAVTGGGELRHFMYLPFGTEAIYPALSQSRAWFMSANLGVRWRPVPTNVNLVFEGQFMTPPTQGSIDRTFTNEPRPRSAYLLVDDLPFNSYAMAGFYRPMFGMYTPDHDSLAARISGLSQRAIFKSIGIGAAPNVPFLVFNYIFPIENPLYDQSKGIVVNLGARWVVLGASLTLSYWNTSMPDPAGSGADLNRQMLSINGGMKVGRFVLNGEILYVKRDFAPGLSDAGSVITVQGRYRLWREIYAQLLTAFGNTSMALKEGSASELTFGLRGFLLSGIDVELNYVSRATSSTSGSLSQKGLQLMTHLYF